MAPLISIFPLSADPQPELWARVDELLAAAKTALVPPSARLEPVRERVLDADLDRHRILLGARMEAHLAGFIDGQASWPEPGALAISQIVVAPESRRAGVGRILVEALIETCSARFGAPPRPVVASVLSEDGPAARFWDGLGFARDLGHGQYERWDEAPHRGG